MPLTVQNRGLIIPPRVARVQVVVIPVGITAKCAALLVAAGANVTRTTLEARERLYKEVEGIADALKSANVRVKTDLRDNFAPGYKFNDWELKGIPLRIEFGPKDAEKHVVTTSRRDIDNKDDARGQISIGDLASDVPKLLETIQADLFARADKTYRTHRIQVTEWQNFVPALNAKNVVLVPHCEGQRCEDQIKEMSARKAEGDNVAEDARAPAMGAKSLCIPFEQPEGVVAGETACVNPQCDSRAKAWVMFGRSY